MTYGLPNSLVLMSLGTSFSSFHIKRKLAIREPKSDEGQSHVKAIEKPTI